MNTDIFLEALGSLKDKSGTIEEILNSVYGIDKSIAEELILPDVIVAARRARDEKLVSISFDHKRRADIITLKN